MVYLRWGAGIIIKLFFFVYTDTNLEHPLRDLPLPEVCGILTSKVA